MDETEITIRTLKRERDAYMARAVCALAALMLIGMLAWWAGAQDNQPALIVGAIALVLTLVYYTAAWLMAARAQLRLRKFRRGQGI